MTEPTHVVHGVPFVRSGSCTRCGACNCEKLNCGHFSWDAQGKTVCSIHDSLAEVCEECTINKNSAFYHEDKKATHQGCIDFPDNPWIGVVKDGKCGYTFFEIKVDGVSKKDELDAKWVK